MFAGGIIMVLIKNRLMLFAGGVYVPLARTGPDFPFQKRKTGNISPLCFELWDTVK